MYYKKDNQNIFLSLIALFTFLFVFLALINPSLVAEMFLKEAELSLFMFLIAVITLIFVFLILYPKSQIEKRIRIIEDKNKKLKIKTKELSARELIVFSQILSEYVKYVCKEIVKNQGGRSFLNELNSLKPVPIVSQQQWQSSVLDLLKKVVLQVSTADNFEDHFLNERKEKSRLYPRSHIKKDKMKKVVNNYSNSQARKSNKTKFKNVNKPSFQKATFLGSSKAIKLGVKSLPDISCKITHPKGFLNEKLHVSCHDFNCRTVGEINEGKCRKKKSMFTQSQSVHPEMLVPSNNVSQKGNKEKGQKIFFGKTVSSRHVAHNIDVKTKKTLKDCFWFDIVHSTGNELKVFGKIIIERHPNKHIILHKILDKSLKIINIKICKLSTKLGDVNRHVVISGSVLKMSFKINKRKITLRVVLPFVREKYINIHKLKHAGSRSNHTLKNNSSCQSTDSEVSINKLQSSYFSCIPIENLTCQSNSKSILDDKVTESTQTLNKNKKQKVSSNLSSLHKDHPKAMDEFIFKELTKLRLDNTCDMRQSSTHLLDQVGKKEILFTIEEDPAEAENECLQKPEENTQGDKLLGKENKKHDKNIKECVGFAQKYCNQLQEYKQNLNPVIKFEEKKLTRLEIQDILISTATQILDGIKMRRLHEDKNEEKTLKCLFELMSFDVTAYIDDEAFFFKGTERNGDIEVWDAVDLNPLRMCNSLQKMQSNENSFYTDSFHNEHCSLTEVDSDEPNEVTRKVNDWEERFLKRDQSEDSLMKLQSKTTSSTIFFLEGSMFSSQDEDENHIWEDYGADDDYGSLQYIADDENPN